ncbi:MAG: hypothetical protein GF317_09045 [Candidatus Lokiarchaeota archaeon]|nr:hypothetical protein [Candidatus Lokiarchaeota archaeon]MBD3199858.1 hypothetical protein [Candidatus Lokiarchaeota archaeon]
MIELTTLEHAQIIFLIVNVATTHVFSLYMIQKYMKKKVNELLYLGSAFLSSAILNYYPFIISYILILLTQNPLDGIIVKVTFPISFVWIILWIVAYTKLVHQDKRKIILILVSVFVGVFEINYWIIFAISPDIIGNLVRGYYMNWASFIGLYLLGSMIILLISGFDFSYRAINSSDKLTKLKGKLIAIALTFTFFGVFFESIIILHGYWFIVPKTLHILSGLFMYLGFVLPKSIRAKFL